jgi:hypothetical protein
MGFSCSEAIILCCQNTTFQVTDGVVRYVEEYAWRVYRAVCNVIALPLNLSSLVSSHIIVREHDKTCVDESSCHQPSLHFRQIESFFLPDMDNFDSLDPCSVHGRLKLYKKDTAKRIRPRIQTDWKVYDTRVTIQL